MPPPPPIQRMFVTLHHAVELVEGRRSDVVRMLRAAGLVRTLPGLGERVCVPAMIAWWDSLQEGVADAEASPAIPVPPAPPPAPATVRTDIRVGGLGLAKDRKAG